MARSVISHPLLPVCCGALLLCATALEAQPPGDDTYAWPKDAGVLENLKRWQGFKFGILVHQGLYSQLGIVESWELCPEPWVERKGYDDYWTFAQNYRNTKSVFNPVNFDPGKWAEAFKAAGAKYVIYTTKHHDGFCLFDTAFTDFKVTQKGCPFSTNARSNIAKEVFAACRNEGLAVGAYFSKPDWTSTNFWWPKYPPFDRNPNYDVTQYKDRWQNFVTYTHNQINELVSDYGPLDILWLDGCWVRPFSTINASVAEFCKYPHDLDIDMKSIAANARAKQPGILIVDRWVQGPYENYLTPEQKVPDKPLSAPWESCISMGGAWGWVPHDHYKSSRELIQLLVKIVAKGGNLLLGIGPDGKGEFDPQVYARLRDVGHWLDANGGAIYGTSPIEPYSAGNIAYTAGSDRVTYAIYLTGANEEELPANLDFQTKLNGSIRVSLPASNTILDFAPLSNGVRVSISESLRKRLAAQPAVVFRIESSQPDRIR